MINFQELEKVAEFKNGELNWLEGRDINAVYVILVGDEYYIGSSHYTYLRIGQHLNELQKGRHHSDKFQAKFNEVGEFEVYSLDSGIEKDKLQIKEFYYIKKYQPSLNKKLPFKTNVITIKNEEDYNRRKTDLKKLSQKILELGNIEFLSKDDKNRYLFLSNIVTEYERAHHPLPGCFSSLLIDKIYDKMKEMFITQKELAEMLNITESRMSSILNGKRQINLKIAQEIRNKLGISADFIMDCYCCK